MKKVSIISAEEAALKVQDGDTIATGGFVSCACPETLSKALEKRFLETGHPKDLTLFFAAGQGHRDGTGGDHYGHEGMVKRVIGGHWDRAPRLGELALNNKIEAYNLPQGVISHMYRDIAAHNIGTITHVGLKTFADPRNGGGKLNDVTKEDLVKVVNIEGQERLLYKGFPINVVFLRASYCDEYGNCSGMGGKTNCGVLSYAYVDAEMADYVVAVTDCLVDYPNYPAEINQTKVDYVCVVDQIGIPEKIATGAAKPTTDQRKILMAEYCTQVVANTPYFKDGFSYQTGVGGASIASTISLSKIMEEKNIHMGLGVGGLTKPMCELLDRGLARKLVDTQDFDLDAVNNVASNPNHFPISAGEYASPMNKGAFVNKLDYVILASLEVDTHFNCNVVVGSDGIITGAQGGHPDTAQGAKCTIVIAPLLQGRIPAICTDVTTVTTPGESVDIVVTDYGVAVNPRRPDLLEALKAADCVPLKTIEELRDIAYSIVGEPEKVQFGDRIVGIIEARDGTVMDVVREVKPFSFRED